MAFQENPGAITPLGALQSSEIDRPGQIEQISGSDAVDAGAVEVRPTPLEIRGVRLDVDQFVQIHDRHASVSVDDVDEVFEDREGVLSSLEQDLAEVVVTTPLR